MKKKSQEANIYDEIGARFDRNNAAVGNVFANYTNAGQVINASLSKSKKKKWLNPTQIARLRA